MATKEETLKLINTYIKARNAGDINTMKNIGDMLKLKEYKIFKCDYCGRLLGYFDLEDWLCDFTKDEYVCSECYELDLGYDL